jgi:ankyrin repeat protein
MALLAVGVASDGKRRTPLHEAASGGHAGMARLLVRSDACVDACDSHGCTPLLLAACQGHRETARVLLPSNARLAESAADGELLLEVSRPAPAQAAACATWLVPAVPHCAGCPVCRSRPALPCAAVQWRLMAAVPRKRSRVRSPISSSRSLG